MANTFGQSKADETSAWQNNKEMNPQVNSAVTDDAVEQSDSQGDTSWRPGDKTVESPTSSEFDNAEAQKRNENIKTDSPGLTPDIAK